jgi:hypothetical protein
VIEGEEIPVIVGTWTKTMLGIVVGTGVFLCSARTHGLALPTRYADSTPNACVAVARWRCAGPAQHTAQGLRTRRQVQWALWSSRHRLERAVRHGQMGRMVVTPRPGPSDQLSDDRTVDHQP